jgi:hypothetical protein
MKSPIDRFMDKVFKHSNGCWIWIGSRNEDGYGEIRINGSTKRCHRWIYEYHNEPLGVLHCLHKCNNTSCVNPDHLESGTNQENSIYSVKSGRHFCSSKTHCKNGHEFSEDNTYFYERKTKRSCKICREDTSEKRSLTRIRNIPILSIGTRTKEN